MILIWIKGILKTRLGRLLTIISGIAMTVSLIASVGGYISASGNAMTRLAISGVPVDWQIQSVNNVNLDLITTEMNKAIKYTTIAQVEYADVAGFTATTDQTQQTTGVGKVVGISDQYIKNYPNEVRLLLGSEKIDHSQGGALIAQQTAANLHARVGDSITIMLMDSAPVKVNVLGIVDLPNADSFFQGIGLPAGAAPQAPPDNVLILSQQTWHAIFDQQLKRLPNSIQTQLHLKIDHHLPPNPTEAAIDVKSKLHNLEARIAGRAIIGDNIGARLIAVQADALYAKVLFLFLGFPGVFLAILLTMMIASSGEKHRKQEQSILRIQGATTKQIIILQSLDTFIVAIVGIALGLFIAMLTLKMTLTASVIADPTMIHWFIFSAIVGLSLALISVIYPIWHETRTHSLLQTKYKNIVQKPFWQTYYIDILLLILSGIVFLRTASTGYQVVLAPEGVTAVSVNYNTFIAPLFLWIGGLLFFARLSFLFINRKRMISYLLQPVAKNLSGIVSSSLAREQKMLVKGACLVALALSFAVSTSVFNTTYNAQSRIDAQLTNGSDITLSSIKPIQPFDGRLKQLSQIDGVDHLLTMQHRFAYVGTDLQDIYGIDPTQIDKVTHISNAYFANGNAKKTLDLLSNTEDGILVSEETVNDFQLRKGDTLNLRLQNETDHQYTIVPFHFIGIVREFPTAPLDSFLVANKSYLSKMTGQLGSEIILMKTDRTSVKSIDEIAKSAQQIAGLDVKVTDINTTQRTIETSLTSVDLHGLTALELVYALFLIIGTVALLLGLRLTEKRRDHAILKAVGADNKQLNAFIWSESLFILITGLIIGFTLGILIAWMLVKVLTGVFDPPPQMLSVPWRYLGGLIVISMFGTWFTLLWVSKLIKLPIVEELKNR